MQRCEVCGNNYERPLEIKSWPDNTVHFFDCFECAVQLLAPECSECGVRILGHGVVANDCYFCGAHCARKQGHYEIVDNLSKATSTKRELPPNPTSFAR